MPIECSYFSGEGNTVYDLFALSAANSGPLEERLEQVLSQLEPHEQAALRSFAKAVQERGRISLNMRLVPLNGFLTSGSRWTVYEFAAQEAAVSGRPADEIVREKLGPYYGKRIAFDRCFEGGETFHYGNLNMGGLGCSKYGRFCVVLRGDFPHDAAGAAYVPGDSLQRYVSGEGTPVVDHARLADEVAPHSHRGCLACLKHSTDVCHLAEDAWAGCLCSEDTFVEAIFMERPRREDVESVRVASAHYEQLADLAFDDYARDLPEAERAIVGHFGMILGCLREDNIRVEVL